MKEVYKSKVYTEQFALDFRRRRDLVPGMGGVQFGRSMPCFAIKITSGTVCPGGGRSDP